ncbi:hypothetical protein ACFOPN_03025 [Xanthomonas hyacinthi]|nr:hypothetical protein [Xanthomonas hyacinthi]
MALPTHRLFGSAISVGLVRDGDKHLIDIPNRSIDPLIDVEVRPPPR